MRFPSRHTRTYAASTLLCLAAVAASPAIRSGQPWLDSDGNVIDAHGAGLLAHQGTYYWFGSRRTMNATGTQMNGGISLYSSRDLYSWKFESVLIHPFNCTSPDATSAAASPRGYPAPSCRNGNGLDLERPKVVQCGGPGGKFVMWVRGTGYGNSPQLLGVLTADAPTGPYTFVSNASGSDDPFRTVAPGIKNYPAGYQFADATLFTDPKAFKSYVYWRTRMTTGVTGATGFRAMQLTDDCHGVLPATDMRVTQTPNREAPAMFVHEGMYYLYASGTMGWAPTTSYVYSASSPLGNFSASNQDEHYWHAYTKGVDGNSTGWNGTWTVRNGYQLVGAPYNPPAFNGNFVTMALAQARMVCAQASECAGFSFIDYLAAPAPTRMLMVGFRRVVSLYPEHEAGLQPPPIPVPGTLGNMAPAQPGVWAYDSQPTYILPNPHYTRGSQKAPFIYMGDRWSYSGAYGTSKATYVWLPLFVHPADPRVVKVVWRAEWALDDTSLYPF